ncbi:MAG: WG repeat-containing protein [Eubacteriales bacterium]|nr:WG repeat-containing protein [Eubacteriales bacterium]
MRHFSKWIGTSICLAAVSMAVAAPQMTWASDEFRNAKDIGNFADGRAPYQDAVTEKWGYIDTEGNVVVEAQWDIADAFSDGYARVGYRSDSGSSYGYIDTEGDYVTTSGFKAGMGCSEGFGCLEGDEGYIYIDMKTGQDAFGKTFSAAHAFHDGLAGAANENGEWGYIDTTGAWVIEPQYERATNFQEGLAAVMSGDLWGFINESGELVIDYQFDGYSTFSEGYADVEKDDMAGYIDTAGNVVIPLEYENASAFHDGTAWVKKDGKYFRIDKNGNQVGDNTWDNVFSGTGNTRVILDGKTGYANPENEVVLQPIYEDATAFTEDGLGAVKKNGRWYLIDQSGVDILDGTDTTKE